MLYLPETRSMGRGFFSALGALGTVGIVVCALGVIGAEGDARAPQPSASPPVADTLVVGDTRANLQMAFANEINAKERYNAAAKQADRDGYPYVAQLFRACARAEQVHAEQHVHAIAWTGGEARALLERLSLGTTAENLMVSIDLETYEATRLYPALVARAEEEHMSAAVRSMNFALAAEREHARLLGAALQTLDQRLPVGTFFVCPTCGRTVESLEFEKCPNCFTSAKKFIRVT